MISKIINGEEYLLVEVPELGHEFEIYNHYIPPLIDFWKFKSSKEIIEITLPKAKWQMIGKANELTEEQCKEIARELPVGNRWENKSDYPIWFSYCKRKRPIYFKKRGITTRNNTYNSKTINP